MKLDEFSKVISIDRVIGMTMSAEGDVLAFTLAPVTGKIEFEDREEEGQYPSFDDPNLTMAGVPDRYRYNEVK